MEPHSEQPLVKWSAPQCPYTVEYAPSTNAVVGGGTAGTTCDSSTPHTAKSFWESYGSITTAGLFALPFPVTLPSPDRFTGAPVAVTAGIVASSVLDSKPSTSILRCHDFRAPSSRLARRLRLRRRRPWNMESDDPVSISVSPKLVGRRLAPQCFRR